MAAQRSKRTKEELLVARDLVRSLAEVGGFADHYELAIAAGIAPTTVNGYWYGQSVPDGFQLIKLLRAAGIVGDDYRLTLPVAVSAESVVAARQSETETPRDESEDSAQDARQSA